jgi:hypothetical protein
LQAALSAQNGTISNLQSDVAALGNKLLFVTVDGTEMYITGANLNIRDGSGQTIIPINSGSTDHVGAVTNGLGNLVIGYNETDGTLLRAGSHNLVIGPNHTYTSAGGLVAGFGNTITGLSTSVTGGSGNRASDNASSVSGGQNNVSNANWSSVSGGQGNTAGNCPSCQLSDSRWNSVSGGSGNFARRFWGSISGGSGNVSNGNNAWIGGGSQKSIVDGHNSAILGGSGNHTERIVSTMIGGTGNTAPSSFSVVIGGQAGVNTIFVFIP